MKQNIFILFMVLISIVASAQNVGVGSNNPPSKLTIVGPSNSPSIPGNTSTGVFRIGITVDDGIDFGKLTGFPFSFSGWMQAGYNGNATDPLSIQPLGGRIGMGTINPHSSAALDVTSIIGGFLPPRMTKTQRDAIPTPLAEGLTIYNTTSRCLETWERSQWYGPCNIDGASYPGGTVFCDGTVTKIIPVLNPVTGKTWMDRNLGASRVAISSTDADSYGDLYQWGRRSDGHQCRNSSTTTTLSSTDQPAHGDFILAPGSPCDWRSPQNDNLWQGVNGVNNPCPTGYRLPSFTELNNERLSWVQPPISSTNNAAGAFASPLKLPVAGFRYYYDGSLSNVGDHGDYWSSTVSSTNVLGIEFWSGNAGTTSSFRGKGLSVRCLKD